MRWFQLFFQNPYSGTWTRSREPRLVLGNFLKLQLYSSTNVYFVHYTNSSPQDLYKMALDTLYVFLGKNIFIHVIVFQVWSKELGPFVFEKPTYVIESLYHN